MRKSIVLLSMATMICAIGFTSCSDEDVDVIAERKANMKEIELTQRTLSVTPGYNAPSTSITDLVIDLGIGVKFAAFNVGATKVDEPGDFYRWGEIEPSTINTWSVYDYHENFTPRQKDKYDNLTNGGVFYITKYCFDLNGDINDCSAGQTLLSNDDAAYVNWGTDWRMPTVNDFKVLFDNIDTTNDNSDPAKCLTAKMVVDYEDETKYLTITNKTTNVSLVLPFTERIPGLASPGNGCYWTKELSSDKSTYAIYVDSSLSSGETQRCCPCYIRPVLND